MDRLAQRLRLNRFVVLGRVGMDLYADPPGAKIETAKAYFPAIGGSAGNIAVALARQGAGVALLSCVSDDAIGRYCLSELRGYGVRIDYIRAVTGGPRTSLAVTETVASGCQTVLYRNGAADFALDEGDVKAFDFAPVGGLVVTGTALAAEPSRRAAFAAMDRARSTGAVVVLDLDYRAYSWTSQEEAAEVCRRAAALADVTIGNDDEFGLLAGSHDQGRAFCAALPGQGAAFSVYKRGHLGCETFTQGEHFETPIFRVAALKPTGAGDGFMGGLLAGLAAGHGIKTSVRRGAATAAMIVSGIGCAPASPDTPALDAFIAEHR